MMRVSYISLCGFRGYKNEARINFAPGFTVISGRNGVGKSTLCDAIEYALTGTINKYSDTKSDGESVENYIWWRGKSPASNNFVEVGFIDEAENIHVVRRTKGGPEPQNLKSISVLMCHEPIAPASPLIQICKSSIIRDEFISSLSLDLKETERFQLLRDALGTPDSDTETDRANELKRICTTKLNETNAKREHARTALKEITAKIEQLRARISEDAAIKEATKFLNDYISANLPPDKLIPTARDAIGKKRAFIENLERFLVELTQQTVATKALSELKEKQESLTKQIYDLDQQIEEFSKSYSDFMDQLRATQPQESVRALSELLSIGQMLGLQEGHCPLCNVEHTNDSFTIGLSDGFNRLKSLSTSAEDMALQKSELENKLKKLRISKEKNQTNLSLLQSQIQDTEKKLERLSALRLSLKLSDNVSAEEVHEKLLLENEPIIRAESALRILDTISFNTLLESSQRERQDAEKKVEELEGKLATARKAESMAKALYDASRRAANEALDDRLDLIGPLLGDLYRRLRPHTSWRDIDYRIRGDVKRFLSLEIGDGLNPQFIFSSGQRRATGLAFLLSIYLATSWSKFRTIILDDPVQHIDDFRAVHLAEVLASLHGQGHQVICAVEDAALANLLCRRLPILSNSNGLHIELGENEFGVLSVIKEQKITNFNSTILAN